MALYLNLDEVDDPFGDEEGEDDYSVIVDCDICGESMDSGETFEPLEGPHSGGTVCHECGIEYCERWGY